MSCTLIDDNVKNKRENYEMAMVDIYSNVTCFHQTLRAYWKHEIVVVVSRVADLKGAQTK